MIRREILGRLGEFFAAAVYSYKDAGHPQVAAWLERRCLNPIQRRLGAPVSDYASKL